MRFYFCKILVVFGITLQFQSFLCLQLSYQPQPDKGGYEVNKIYEESVTYGTPKSYSFRLDPKINVNTTRLKFEVKVTENGDMDNPILFAVGGHESFKTIKLPFNVTAGEGDNATITPFSHSIRGLCLEGQTDEVAGRDINIFVTTGSKGNVKFTIALWQLEDLAITTDEKQGATFSPSSPIFFRYTFPEEIETVRVTASSELLNCVTMSVQSLKCPVYDLESNVRYAGKWETMTKSASIVISKKHGRYAEGFFISFVAHVDQSICEAWGTFSYNKDDNRVSFMEIADPYTKELTVTVTNASSAPDWIFYLSMGIPLVGTILIATFVLCLFCIMQGRMLKRANPSVKLEDDSSQSVPLLHTSFRRNLRIADLYLPQHLPKIHLESKGFRWGIITISLFYAIPAYQLVLNYFRILYNTGEYDLCYYNYLCANQFGKMIDFNHFWSNVCYIIFGVFFIAIVLYRSRKLWEIRIKMTEAVAPINQNREECMYHYGVPMHFGVYYALSIALIMEGALSAAYHICPNNLTFQFDLCFMYAISVLVILKIYEFRHPGHCGANATYVVLGIFMSASVVAVVFENTRLSTGFLIVVAVLQFILLALFYVYHNSFGYVTEYVAGERELVVGFCLFLHWTKLRFKPSGLMRLILPVSLVLICTGNLIYALCKNADVSSYVLHTIVLIVVFYIFYYAFIMKTLYGEYKICNISSWLPPLAYFTLSIIFGGIALHFFSRAPSRWELPASHSRTWNEHCLQGLFPFYPFYDSHDAWHMLSAISLFLMFMGLLTVDDGLIMTHQSEIHVF